MQKDFDQWNEHKKAIDANPAPRVYVHERELWFAHLGTNIGFEQDGRGNESLRPILVLRKFNSEIVWALPLTRRDKTGNPYYLSFEYIVFPEYMVHRIVLRLQFYRSYDCSMASASATRSAPYRRRFLSLLKKRSGNCSPDLFCYPLRGGPKPFVH